MTELTELIRDLPVWLLPITAFIAVVLINRAVSLIILFATQREKIATSLWLRSILEAIHAPLRAFLWLLGIGLIGKTLQLNEDINYLPSVAPVVYQLFIIFNVSWFAFRFVKRVEAHYIEQANQHEGFDPMAVDAISKLSLATVFIFTLMAIMQALGVSVTGLLAFGGAAGVAIGFAAQSLVANLLGGLTIFASRIFTIGEFIILPDSGLSGSVQYIGWRSTRVLGFDRKPFYVPNAVFNTSTVINHSRMTNRKIEHFIHLRYQDIDKVSAIIAEGNAFIAQHAEIDQTFFVFRLDSYSETTVRLLVHAFTISTEYVDYMRIKEEIFLEIARIIRTQGGELALPVTHVNLESSH